MNILILCLKIFFARICDVSLGTSRMILVIKEKRFLATVMAFLEVTIWFTVAREALNNADASFFVVLAYAGGFAAGTLIGSLLSSKFIEGKLNVQIITSENDVVMIERIKEEGFGASAIKMQDGKFMIITEVDKRHYKDLIKYVNEVDSKAFIYVNETKFVENGFFQRK